MPENTSLKNPDPPSLKNSLRLKVASVIIIATLLHFILGTILNISHRDYFQMAFLAVVISATGVFLIFRFLKPLEQLYLGAQILAKGELKHRFNIHTGDELEAISTTFNELAQNLDRTIQDISQNKDNLTSEKNKLNTIISSIVDGVIVLDMQRKVVLTNKAIEKITGYKANEMIGQPINSLIALKDQNGKLVETKAYCSISPDKDKDCLNILATVTLVGKGGQSMTVDVTTAQIAEEFQADLGCLLIIRDVSQKEVFRQMQIDFVSMASHEIRTPLTSIVGYLSTLSEEGKLKGEMKEFLDRALLSAQQLSVLVNNLLNVSKIERESFAVSLQPLDWNKVLAQAVTDNKPQAVQKRISLKLSLPDKTLPKVMADATRISEVLNNLLSNAITYTKEGGTVEIGTKISADTITTHISDNGVGIPKEAIPHLFTKFFRVSGALEQGSKGTGLGLYISKSIIDLHHGKIWAESEPGKGSIFYFSLPLAPSSKTAPTIASLRQA